MLFPPSPVLDNRGIGMSMRCKRVWSTVSDSCPHQTFIHPFNRIKMSGDNSGLQGRRNAIFNGLKFFIQYQGVSEEDRRTLAENLLVSGRLRSVLMISNTAPSASSPRPRQTAKSSSRFRLHILAWGSTKSSKAGRDRWKHVDVAQPPLGLSMTFVPIWLGRKVISCRGDTCSERVG